MNKTATLLALSALTLAANAGEVTTTRTAVQPRLEASNPGFGNVLFAGIDTREEATYGYAGLIHALNCDLNESGFFVRGFLGYGEYEYRNFGLLNPEVEGELFDADLGLGYKYVINDQWNVSAFAAGHYHSDERNQVDPSNTPDDDDFGGRFGADITGTTGPIWWNGIAQYSTIEDAKWARARVGYNFGRVVVGPEFIYLEDGRFEEKRIGAFVKFQATDALEISASIGNADIDAEGRSSDDSALYGTVGVGFCF